MYLILLLVVVARFFRTSHRFFPAARRLGLRRLPFSALHPPPMPALGGNVYIYISGAGGSGKNGGRLGKERGRVEFSSIAKY